MSALWLTEDDVDELMDIPAAIDVMEEMFGQLAAGQASNVPRARVQSPGVMLHTMSAAATYLGLVGWKAYTTTADGARFHVAVYRVSDGALVALIEANRLGQMRTAAASGVATEYMARPDACVVGVFGTGFQARGQLKAVCSVRKIERVEVYSRDAERRRLFSEEMSEWCNTEVVPVHAPDDAATEKDIVICATTARTPVFDGRVLDEGTHLNVVGSNFKQKAEIDVTTIRRSDVIACDSIEQCQIEAGDFNNALIEGVTDWSLMHELSAIVAGKATGRATPDAITLFKSVGLAIEDVALAAAIIDRAHAAGLGTPLPF